MLLAPRDATREKQIQILTITNQLRKNFPYVPGQPIDVNKVLMYMHAKGYPWGTMDIGLLNDELLREF